MTAFSEADLDRLADFVGGALDGTPEADDVRHLVITDTGWAEAYAALVATDATMRDELHALGAEAVVVPLEVQRRLEAALTEAITAPTADAPVVDLNRAREARRRRRGRWIGGLAAAAAVIACAGAGLQVFRSGTTTGSDTSRSDTPNLAGAPPDTRSTYSAGGSGTGANSVGSGAIGPLITSGRDYSRGNVTDLTRSATASARGLEGAQGDGARPDSLKAQAPGPTGVPGALLPLTDPVARTRCLTAVTREYGGQVTLADYAEFEGQPALVLVLDGSPVGQGKRFVVVVGPDCGIGGAIQDERYHTTAP